MVLADVFSILLWCQGLYSLFGKEAIRHQARIDSPGQRQGKDGPGAGFA
jgi:hypothetical protein